MGFHHLDAGFLEDQSPRMGDTWALELWFKSLEADGSIDGVRPPGDMNQRLKDPRPYSDIGYGAIPVRYPRWTPLNKHQRRHGTPGRTSTDPVTGPATCRPPRTGVILPTRSGDLGGSMQFLRKQET